MGDVALGLVGRAWRKAGRISQRARERARSVPVRIANQKSGTPPIPPSRLIFAIANTEDASWYLHSGADAARSLREILGRNGLAVERMGDVLDFGCGVGRVLRHWSGLSDTRFLGCDLSPKAIVWCQQHLTFARFQVNALDRPLHLPDQSLDLAYAFSVFTHLSEGLQDFWMREMSRLLRPGGYLVFSAHGDHYLAQLDSDERRLYLSGRFVARKTSRDGSNDCAAFHPPSYVREELARGWDVVDFVPEGAFGNPRQDLYLLRKPV